MSGTFARRARGGQVAIQIGSNNSAQAVIRQLSRSTSAVSIAAERLASGQRINRASDDAAGLAISSRLESDRRVYTQGLRNLNDGISAIGIVQGALTEGSSVLIRIKELATQAASGSFSRVQRVTMDLEASQLTDEYNRIFASTKFNNISLLSGDLQSIAIQAGFGTDGILRFSPTSELTRKRWSGTGSGTNVSSGTTNLTGVVVGDVNGDGKDDLIFADTAFGATAGRVKLSNGDGTFAATSNFFLQVGDSGNSIQLADLNGDGRLDILVASDTGGGSGGVGVFFGNGNGTFGVRQSYITGQAYSTIATGDFDGDGKVDVVASRADTNYALIAYGTGNGTVRSSSTIQIADSGAAISVVVGDLDGDGRSDLVATGGYVLRSGGTNFIKTGSISSSIIELQLGDLNRDGLLDLVGFNGVQTIRQFGSEGGTFGGEQVLTFSLVEGGGIVLDDFDGDGNLDLIQNYDQGNGLQNVYFASGDGAGGFGTPRMVAPGQSDSAQFYKLGDFNGDGVSDAFAGALANSMPVYLSTTNDFTSIKKVDLTRASSARLALDSIEVLLGKISRGLGSLGAAQSRIESATRTIDTARENFAAAAGRIKDADVAYESSEMLRGSIIQRTAAAVLSQANQQPALALQLLRS
jgi:flagellin